MVNRPRLQPTAWRTCRALANRSRLAMLRLLLLAPGQTVTAVARRLHQPLPLVSLNLRALEARGVLAVQRRGRQAAYRPSLALNPISTAGLAIALRARLRPSSAALNAVYRLMTAFTHPRRVEIYRLLQRGPGTVAQLRMASHISERALRRHLQKLATRGFVTHHHARFAMAPRTDSLRRALARLALQ